MPGVPSGRGCDACRNQKKKCDLAVPACRRCTRLRIKCLGAGQQRYKFIHHTITEPTPLRIVPGNETSLIAKRLISRLEVKDIRYDTSCFGAFIRLIPQRIGSIPALDIAADTFAIAYSNLHLEQNSVQALTSHGRALTALRDCLKRLQKRQVAEIVSAIYLTMINDNLIARRELRPHVCHMEILVYLLQMTADWKWTSQYELEVLLTITGVVVMESVRNPQIKLEPWVWKVVEKIEAPDSVRSQKVGCRAARKDPERFPSLGLRRIIEVVQLVREPSQHCSNLEYRYQQLLDDREKLKRQPKALFYSNDPITQQKPPQVQLGFQTRRATVLTLAMLANVVLQELSPSNTSLSTERDILVDESIAASQIPNHYRPLGACYVTHCLIVAYTVTRDAKQQEIIARLLNELCNLDVTPVTTSRWLEEGVQGWRSKLESLRQLAPGLVLLSAAICRQAGRQE